MEISPRLHDALVADLVQEAIAEGDREEVETLMREPIRDEHEVTRHLRRQLDISEIEGSGIHDTLWTLKPELEGLLHEWPPNQDGKAGDVLAQLACKNLGDYEVYATLLAGPTRWRAKGKVDCHVENLPANLLPILQRGLAASLNGMLGRWTRWDVRRLRARVHEERRISEAAEQKARLAQTTPEVRRRKREDDRKQWANPFTRPGRIT